MLGGILMKKDIKLLFDNLKNKQKNSKIINNIIYSYVTCNYFKYNWRI